MPFRTAAGTAGVETPRPCARLPWVAAVIAVLHGALIAAAWQGTPPPEKPRAQRVSMRLVAAPLRAEVPVPMPVPRVKTAAAPRRQVPTKASPPPPPERTAEPVSGAVFALPRIGFGTPGPARWMNPPSAPVAAPPPLALMAQAQAQAAREAGRAQIIDALQRQIGEMPPPADTTDGSCALQLEPAAHLACDRDSLREALAAREPMLAGLLAAYRQVHPQASRLSIAYAEGRYQLDL